MSEVNNAKLVFDRLLSTHKNIDEANARLESKGSLLTGISATISTFLATWQILPHGDKNPTILAAIAILVLCVSTAVVIFEASKLWSKGDWTLAGPQDWETIDREYLTVSDSECLENMAIDQASANEDAVKANEIKGRSIGIIACIVRFQIVFFAACVLVKAFCK